MSAYDVDQLWLILGTILVMFMHGGFTLLEVGSVASKNTNNILTKNLMMPCLGALCWFGLGYGFAFGKDDGSGFIGTDGFGTGTNWLGPVTYSLDEDGNVPDPSTMHNGDAWWVFQFSFCATAATIVSGAVAERLQFTAYFCYTVMLTLFVYPVVAHWAWTSDGWAQNMEINGEKFAVQDFAGSGVVHMVGGMAALMGIILLGPRTGRFDANGKPVAHGFNGQSSVFCTLGTIILWVGWYGFNCVSTGGIEGNGNVAGHVAKTTTLSAALGGITTFIFNRFLTGRWEVSAGNNGILSGLVAITAGCAVVEDYGAICIGIVAAFVYIGSSKLLLRFGLDDVVDAVPVHFFNGFWGVVAVGFFSSSDQAGCGVFYKSQNYLNATTGLPSDIPYRSCQGNQGSFLATQICFALAIIVWVGTLSFILFWVLRSMKLLRLSQLVENQGLDEYEHGGSAYETSKDISTRAQSFRIVKANNVEESLASVN